MHNKNIWKSPRFFKQYKLSLLHYVDKIKIKAKYLTLTLLAINLSRRVILNFRTYNIIANYLFIYSLGNILQGLAITLVSDENDAKILNDVQERFDVNITELPDEIDLASYSKFKFLKTQFIVSG